VSVFELKGVRRSSGLVAPPRRRCVEKSLMRRMYSFCVYSPNLRTAMSSIMRCRSGLMGFSLIGVLLVLRWRFVNPFILKPGHFTFR
jgi:hypothetical protein